MERKAFATEFKVSGDGRTVEGYASTFGNVDLVGDVVMPGAYKKTIAQRKNRIRVLRDHEAPIGVLVDAVEDSKGLHTITRLSDTPLGNETLTLLRDGAIDSMSIGYAPLVKDYTQKDGQQVRLLKEIRLDEVSYVTFPANEEAGVVAVKQIEALDRAFAEYKAGRLSADELASLVKAAPAVDAPSVAPAAVAQLHPETPGSDNPESAALLAEIKAMLGDYRSQFRRAA
jgi:HK97 family phage prohead protease